MVENKIDSVCYERAVLSDSTDSEGSNIVLYEYLHPENETGLSLVPYYFSGKSLTKEIYKGNYLPANGQPFEFICKNLGFEVHTEKSLKESGRSIPKRFIRPSSFTYYVDMAVLGGAKETYWHESCSLNPFVKNNSTKNTSMGTAFHKLVEVDGDLEKLSNEGVVAYQPVDSKDWGYNVLSPTRTTKKYFEAYAKIKESYPDKEVVLLSPMELDLVVSNFKKYRDYLVGVLSNYEIIGREVRFDTDNFLGTGYALGGTIDILAKNKETNRYTIIDIKTSSDSDTILKFESIGRNPWESSKIYQVVAYAYLASLHYNIPLEDFDVMFLPVFLSSSTRLCKPVSFRLDQNSINAEGQGFREAFESVFKHMAEFLEDRINRKEFLNDVKEIKSFKLPYITTFTYEQDSIHLENLVKKLGITLDDRYVFEVTQRSKQYKVYKIELYREIARRMGYNICLYEILKDGKPPIVSVINDKINVVISQDSHSDFFKGENQENKFAYVFCYLMDSQGNVVSYDYYDRFDLQKMDDFAISDSFKTNHAWKVYAKQMQYKAATKLLLNKSFKEGGIYKSLYDEEAFQLLDRITNQQYKEIMG